MSPLLRVEHPSDHPTRERSDHANIDPRRPKHPKSTVHARAASKKAAAEPKSL